MTPSISSQSLFKEPTDGRTSYSMMRRAEKNIPWLKNCLNGLNSAERNKKLSRKNGATQTHCNPPATEPAVSPNDMAKTQSIQVAHAPPELFTRTSNPFVVSMSTEHMFRSSAERTCFIV